MKGIDKFLVGIVIGIVVLVVVAFVLVANRPEPTYQTGTSASDVAHNYLLALQKKEYDRAYSYLSPDLVSYPTTLDAFIDDVDNQPWRFRIDHNVTLVVKGEKTVGSRMVVSVQEARFYRGDLFSSRQSMNNFEIKLKQVNNKWRIVDGDYYFATCWQDTDGCQ